MKIHVVKSGETLYSIALLYDVPMSLLIEINQLQTPSQLVVGQTLVILFPEKTYTVKDGDTLYSIAKRHNLPLRTLYENNPALRGSSQIMSGQVLVLTYKGEKQGTLSVNGYAYPNIQQDLLQSTLPYLTQLAPFTYGFTQQGKLIGLDDQAMVDAAVQMGVQPLLHLSTLTGENGFSDALAHLALTDPIVQKTLIAEIMQAVQEKGYCGVDVDFEYLYATDAQPFAAFLRALRSALAPFGLPLLVAVAPKTHANQTGKLYEGHDYKRIGEAADFVLLMTYEWGYSYGPPAAVAPIDKVREVLDYAVREIPPEKIYLGIPNYGYVWQIPYQKEVKAQSISNEDAVRLAYQHYACIRFDKTSQTPWFRYVDQTGQENEVWFEDARSIHAKLSLVKEYGLYGVGYWNLMRPFAQNWAVLNAMYHIRGAGG